MTPWLDLRDRLTPEKSRKALHALIVATSRYAELPHPQDPMRLQQLDSVTTGAYRFARWLRHRYYNPEHPLGTLQFLLSPSEREKRCGVPDTGTSREQVRIALDAWRARCWNDGDGDEGMALLYVAGHGVLWGAAGGAVLLQDYVPDPMAMDRSLDIARVCDGLQEVGYPEKQLYFVDACRAELPAEFEPGGVGLGWEAPEGAVGVPTAPIYFATAPAAFTVTNRRSTFFSQALLRCLDGYAADDPSGDDPWQVTVLSLTDGLLKAMNQLASAANTFAQPLVDISGSFPFHVFRRPPKVNVTIRIDPRKAASVAHANMRPHGRKTPVFRGARFRGGRLVRKLPVGNYLLDVIIKPRTPPFRSQRNILCQVDPRKDPRTVRLA